MCKQHHRITLNPFLNGKKNGDVNGTCKRSLINGDRSTKDILTKMSSKIARPVHCELRTLFVFVHPHTADTSLTNLHSPNTMYTEVSKCLFIHISQHVCISYIENGRKPQFYNQKCGHPLAAKRVQSLIFFADFGKKSSSAQTQGLPLSPTIWKIMDH